LVPAASDGADGSETCDHDGDRLHAILPAITRERSREWLREMVLAGDPVGPDQGLDLLVGKDAVGLLGVVEDLLDQSRLGLDAARLERAPRTPPPT
ncbi:MAG TPA: hypothetical protein VM778_10815, partial [Gemmatimonadota bacterium]|nr:hypothetical protein [Gemmatimonadota bacterium]